MRKLIKVIVIILIAVMTVAFCACNNEDEKKDVDIETRRVCLYCGYFLKAPCSTYCSVCGVQVKSPHSYPVASGKHTYDNRDICTRCGESKLEHWVDGFDIED